MSSIVERMRPRLACAMKRDERVRPEMMMVYGLCTGDQNRGGRARSRDKKRKTYIVYSHYIYGIIGFPSVATLNTTRATHETVLNTSPTVHHHAYLAYLVGDRYDMNRCGHVCVMLYNLCGKLRKHATVPYELVITSAATLL